MTAIQLLANLNATGGIVYPDGKEACVFCWAGIEKGHVWYHRGDQPAWGPAIADLTVQGDQALQGTNPDGSLAFYMTTFDECPEIQTGRAMMVVDSQREEMTREQAISWLGDPPPDGGLAGQGDQGAAQSDPP